MKKTPSIGLHAHIKPDIAPSELTALDALIFAATRSSAEAEQVSARHSALGYRTPAEYAAAFRCTPTPMACSINRIWIKQTRL